MELDAAAYTLVRRRSGLVCGPLEKKGVICEGKLREDNERLHLKTKMDFAAKQRSGRKR
jgi:hypothetical protein